MKKKGKRKKEKENENKNDETLMSSKDDDNGNENEDENKDDDDDDDDDDDETMSQNEVIKGKNDILDKIIDKSKSFEEQIKSLEKRDLKGYWSYDNFGDKELKFKYFQIKLAEMLKIIDKKLFEQIFGHTLETLANKLINTTNKKENQIIVENIEINFTKNVKRVMVVIM